MNPHITYKVPQVNKNEPFPRENNKIKMCVCVCVRVEDADPALKKSLNIPVNRLFSMRIRVKRGWPNPLALTGKHACHMLSTLSGFKVPHEKKL